MSEGKTDRERRLADALRANLRRRKGQARERVDTDAQLSPTTEPGSSDRQPDDKD